MPIVRGKTLRVPSAGVRQIWSCAGLLLLYCAAPCATPSIIREGGILYASPYEQEVRMKIRSIKGHRLGDVIQKANIEPESQENLTIFDSITPEGWLNQLRAGKVRVERNGWRQVNLEAIDEDYVVQDDDRVRVTIHVHERAAPDVEIPIIYEDKNYMAVSKPPGLDIFVSPIGGSVKLSVVGMLESMGYAGVMPAHRIDKPVSGVLCLAKNNKAMSRLQRCIKGRRVNKTYVARTLQKAGIRPSAGQRITAPLGIRTNDRGNRIAEVSEDGKEAETVIVEVMKEHEDGTSTLAIKLLSGRMHQIRCHLNHTGYPIANDPVYGGVGQPCPELYTGPLAQDLLRENFQQHCRKCELYQKALATRLLLKAFPGFIFFTLWDIFREALLSSFFNQGRPSCTSTTGSNDLAPQLAL